MTTDDYAVSLLAIMIYREARGEGVAGMQAVAHVVLNRVSKTQLGTLAQKVVKVICSFNQFSSMTVRGDAETVLWPLLGDPCFQIAEDAYSGVSLDNTGGALYYANEATMTSTWYRSNIINCPQHSVTATIGSQTFRK